MEAKQTIERINRGQFRLMIVLHGEGGKNREVQVVDTVHGYMVKGVTEQALIAHILLDARTAAKHFEPVRASKDLAKEEAARDGSKVTGLQRVLKENKGAALSKPASQNRPWPKLRKAKTAEQIQREGEEAEAAFKLIEESGVEVEKVVEKFIQEDVDPMELATVWEFDTDDAKGVFIGIASAFGSAEVEKYLEKEKPDGVLTEEFIAAMGNALSDEHVKGSKVEVIEEKPKKKAAPKTFKPKK